MPAEEPAEVYTAMDQGDLHWVFPDLDDQGAEEVRGILEQAAGTVRRLADHFGVPAGRTGAGLEYRREHIVQIPALYGSATAAGIAFHVELAMPRACLWGPNLGPPWGIHGFILASCADSHHEGEDWAGFPSHTVAEVETSAETPVLAARDLVRAAEWLLDRGMSRPPQDWLTAKRLD